jgi:hypothetical protein
VHAAFGHQSRDQKLECPLLVLGVNRRDEACAGRRVQTTQRRHRLDGMAEIAAAQALRQVAH